MAKQQSVVIKYNDLKKIIAEVTGNDLSNIKKMGLERLQKAIVNEQVKSISNMESYKYDVLVIIGDSLSKMEARIKKQNL